MSEITWRTVPAAGRAGAVRSLLAQGYAFHMCFAEHGSAGIDLVYLLSGPQGGLLAVRAPLGGEGDVASLVDDLPALHWDEREIQDMFGLRFSGHPDPRPLLLPDAYQGSPPLAPQAPPAAREPWRPHSLRQHGIVEVPVGPVHAGIIESGHFLFTTVGETILQLDARLSWNHRGVEANLQGRSLDEAIRIVERTCGSCSAAHQEAFSQAVETIAGVEVPSGTLAWRAAILEMERIYNHLNDLGQLATGVALAVLAQQGMRLKERALRMQEAAFGHRYLFGTIRPGQVRPPKDRAELAAGLGRLRDDSAVWADRLFANVGFRDRLAGMGRVHKDAARSLGAVGPAARASGIAADVRSDLPYGAYRSLDLAPETATAGDALARAEIRRLELAQSFTLAIAMLQEGGEEERPGALGAELSGAAAAIVESPRGAETQFLRLSQGRVERLHLRSASFANWPLIMVAAADNPIGDFPLINKSFELCYACCDR
ncbi:MAG: NADH-quinone oxidoreductase subunit C [Thermaerobacter sp.]|nr:NADH-quinone oxidoreductase subunit C [Thermaerobacter sp.]